MTWVGVSMISIAITMAAYARSRIPLHDAIYRVTIIATLCLAYTELGTIAELLEAAQ